MDQNILLLLYTFHNDASLWFVWFCILPTGYDLYSALYKRQFNKYSQNSINYITVLTILEKNTAELNVEKKKTAHLSVSLSTRQWTRIPTQWWWPPDLLPFALATVLCQYSFYHSGTHQHSRTVHRSGWSAWTKSKQITFPAVTDLQPSDSTAARGRQHHGTTGMNHLYLFLLAIKSVTWWGE